MKKKIAFALLLSIVLGCSAVAKSITIDLENATMDELKEVRDSVNDRIIDLTIESSPEIDENFIISGNGTMILDGVKLDADLSRFCVTSSDGVKVTYYTENDSRTLSPYLSSNTSVSEYIEKTDISSIMVESSGDWKIDLSPIGKMESPYISGEGQFISDRFTVKPPVIVTITLTRGTKEEFLDTSLYLCKITKDGYIFSERVIYNEWIKDIKTFDAIIKPDDNVVSYFWFVDCPCDMKWSIEAK